MPKRCAIFRWMANNTSGNPQHSANLDFNKSKVFPFFFTQKAAPLSYSHLAHALLSDLQQCIMHRVKLDIMGLLLVYPSRAAHFAWLASYALECGPQTTHPAAPRPSSDPSGNMALMVACLT